MFGSVLTNVEEHDESDSKGVSTVVEDSDEEDEPEPEPEPVKEKPKKKVLKKKVSA